ncbi:hypothetical protein CC86DRAFT_366252 [Ophiobolus disseminans]|uniref:Uncharacterized protein n=1 Tax=Ophiobolus disseminans TaxID=1469910 RepID=A0A6A7AGP2_9PLEO|nr:hypothetical protein CC86DRAFT_366252 [Ophiobolus disseminans]
MGLDTKRPPLPAPTEPSTLDSADDTFLRTDVETNVSTRTDKTSYSVPEDGTPITINTTKPQGTLHKKFPSQTSLLIEYFEAGKTEGKTRSRPSVRVRVTPSSRKSKSTSASDHVQITQTSRNPRKPSYTRRISLGSKPRDEIIDTRTSETFSELSNFSSLPPVEIEVLQNTSDVSSNDQQFNLMASDISSMPPDSMLGGPPQIRPPGRRRSRSLEREDIHESMALEQDTLKAPKHQRSRSLSKDRITQRVMEKLQQQQGADASSSKSTKKITKEELTSPRKSHRRRSKDVEEVSGTESSLLSSNADRRSGMSHSARSGVSGTSSSINNPKLLATVEDAIKRLILPELNALKEENRTSRNKDKFERMSRENIRDSGTSYDVESTTSSREPSRRRMSKSSSAPKLQTGKPKVVLNRHGDDPGVVLSGDSIRKERRSSRGSTSDRSYAESTTREKTHRKKSKDKSSTTSVRDAALAGLAGAGLTAAALKSHTSREEKEEERKHRKRHSSRSSRSRSASISESVEDVYVKEHVPVPPLPFNHSELIGSEMTRDSILSAETETNKRPESRDSRSSTNTGLDRSLGIETPLHDVPRGILSPAPRTPTRTPNALQKTIGTAHSNRSVGDIRTITPKSDRSYFSRREETSTSAAQQAAAAAKARAIERSNPQASQYELAEEEPPNRGVSPIQSEASYRQEVTATGSPRYLRSYHSGASISSLGQPVERQQSNLSIGSLESTASTKAARTRKRPQGITLESKRSVLGEVDTPRDAEDFFEKNHEQNEIYRRELEESSQASPSINYKRMTNYTDDSAEGQYLDLEEKVNFEDVRKVGVTPEYVHTPLAVESAVASLHDPSNISVRSSVVSSPVKKSRLSQVSPSPSAKNILQADEVPSGQRWATIREKAEVLAHQLHGDNSPRQSVAQSIDERQSFDSRRSFNDRRSFEDRKSFEQQPQMHHSAFPTDDHMMPEIGYGISDNESEVDTNPSIIQGPLGGVDGYHDQTDDLLSRQEERERTPTSFSKGGALGAGAGAAAIAAAAAHHLNNQSPLSYDSRRQASVDDDYDQEYAGETQYEQPGYAQSNRTPLSGQAAWRDEGYQSANAREAYTPQNRNYTRGLDDDRHGEDFDDTSIGGAGMFDTNHNRQASGNSHGIDSPLYDSATGKGVDRIQSKDIVALMDHLTVRDAQRNARDTEILVTLVRSAAETRNQLEDLKQFIKVQDNMIMGTTDKRVGLAEQRILGGPRPQPMSSPRANRSSSEDMDIETKKKSVFKRALKGLSMKGGGDMKHIEDMLMQLLDEVEGLKHVNQLSLDQQARSNSLTSYENLRASGDAGYEPEGRANTASSPNQSGYLSNPSSARRIQDLHSGYDVPATNRVSTVQEVSDEEYDERERAYENTERMTTPTQEAFHERKLSQETPPQVSRAIRDPQSQENTPKRKHKSNSSSIFGIPKISRWSKTTSSTVPETLPRNSGSSEKRPYSAHSRSSSRQSLEYYDDEPYGMQDDDRLRSNTSLAKDDRSSIRSARSARSPSPLIPEDELQYEMEDPKYQAHRNSLNLQHPQPRAGPTGRHQNHLETQAQIYEPLSSPDYDQWGSMPALARNRLSQGSAPQGAGNLSPISSDGGYSQHSASEQQQGPPRPPKIADDGPLIPPQLPLAGYGQTRQMYSSPNEFGSQGALTPLAPIAEVRYSLETERGHRMRETPTPSPRPSSQHLSASSMNSPQRKITGPRPMGSRSPSGQNGLQHSDTVVRRKPIADDQESLQSYRSSLDSEIF